MGGVWNEMVVTKSEAQKLHGQIDESYENTQLIQSVHGARCEPETSRVGRRSVATRSTATKGEKRKRVKIVTH
jgi:hypothetical protein